MNDKGLIQHSIKIIFLLLGIYLIVINIVGLVIYERHIASLNTPLDYTTFNGWHDYQTNAYIGFNWFFKRLESFPGFNNLSELIEQFKVIATSGIKDTGLFGTLTYIASLIALPFKALWAVIVDIISNIIWFFSLLNPWVSNASDLI